METLLAMSDSVDTLCAGSDSAGTFCSESGYIFSGSDSVRTLFLQGVIVWTFWHPVSVRRYLRRI